VDGGGGGRLYACLILPKLADPLQSRRLEGVASVVVVTAVVVETDVGVLRIEMEGDGEGTSAGKLLRAMAVPLLVGDPLSGSAVASSLVVQVLRAVELLTSTIRPPGPLSVAAGRPKSAQSEENGLGEGSAHLKRQAVASHSSSRNSSAYALRERSSSSRVELFSKALCGARGEIRRAKLEGGRRDSLRRRRRYSCQRVAHQALRLRHSRCTRTLGLRALRLLVESACGPSKPRERGREARRSLVVVLYAPVSISICCSQSGPAHLNIPSSRERCISRGKDERRSWWGAEQRLHASFEEAGAFQLES